MQLRHVFFSASAPRIFKSEGPLFEMVACSGSVPSNSKLQEAKKARSLNVAPCSPELKPHICSTLQNPALLSGVDCIGLGMYTRKGGPWQLLGNDLGRGHHMLGGHGQPRKCTLACFGGVSELKAWSPAALAVRHRARISWQSRGLAPSDCLFIVCQDTILASTNHELMLCEDQMF